MKNSLLDRILLCLVPVSICLILIGTLPDALAYKFIGYLTLVLKYYIYGRIIEYICAGIKYLHKRFKK